MGQIEEIKEQEALSGDYLFQHNQQKIFASLPIATSYITAFGIKHFNIRDGHLANGEYVVQISYYRREE